jgi:hypothetical protein
MVENRHVTFKPYASRIFELSILQTSDGFYEVEFYRNV